MPCVKGHQRGINSPEFEVNSDLNENTKFDRKGQISKPHVKHDLMVEGESVSGQEITCTCMYVVSKYKVIKEYVRRELESGIDTKMGSPIIVFNGVASTRDQLARTYFYCLLFLCYPCSG